jgi:transposase
MESRRAQWAEQVRQWRRSGLTASEFAKRVGINASTLTHWAWRLSRRPEADTEAESRVASSASLVELVAGAIDDRRFELELGDGRRLRIPAQFNVRDLEQLLALLAKPAR